MNAFTLSISQAMRIDICIILHLEIKINIIYIRNKKKEKIETDIYCCKSSSLLASSDNVEDMFGLFTLGYVESACIWRGILGMACTNAVCKHL